METVTFISDDIEEIKKEQKKQQAIHALLPDFMGSSNDETNYILLNKKDKKVYTLFQLLLFLFLKV